MNGVVWVTVVVVPVTVLIARFVLRDWRNVSRRLRREKMRTFQVETAGWENREAEYRLALKLAIRRGSFSAYIQEVADAWASVGKVFP